MIMIAFLKDNINNKKNIIKTSKLVNIIKNLITDLGFGYKYISYKSYVTHDLCLEYYIILVYENLGYNKLLYTIKISENGDYMSESEKSMIENSEFSLNNIISLTTLVHNVYDDYNENPHKIKFIIKYINKLEKILCNRKIFIIYSKGINNLKNANLYTKDDLEKLVK